MQAVNSASNGAVIAIAEGNYDEDVEIWDRPLKLWGRCPDKVVVTGSSQAASTIDIYQQNNSELHGLTATGNAKNSGIGVYDSTGVLLQNIVSRDNVSRGILVQRETRATEASILGSLVEGNATAGLGIKGATATVESTRIWGTLPDTAQSSGRGVDVYTRNAGQTSELTLRGSVIEENTEVGIRVSGSTATIEGTIVRATKPSPSSAQGQGIGIEMAAKGSDIPSMTLKGAIVDGNRELGVQVRGGTAKIENSVIKNTQPVGAPLRLGDGLQADVEFDEISTTVDIARSLIENNQEVGVFGIGIDLKISDSVIRTTAPTSEGEFGFGVVSTSANATHPGSLSMTHSLVDQNHGVGVLVQGGQGEIVDSVIRNTQATQVAGNFGEGVHASDSPEAIPGSLHMKGSLLEANHDTGLSNIGATVVIEESAIRGTIPTPNHESSGVGIAAVSSLNGALSTLEIRASELRDNRVTAIWVEDGSAKVERCLITGTLMDGAAQMFGRAIEMHGRAQIANLEVESSLFEKNYDAEIAATGAHVVVRGSTLRATLPTTSPPIVGRGIAVFDDGDLTSDVTMDGVLIEDNVEAGASMGRIVATIVGSVLRRTQPTPAGGFGRALIFGDAERTGGSLELRGSRIDDNYEAGMSLANSNALIDACVFELTKSRVRDAGMGDAFFIAGESSVQVNRSRVNGSARAGISVYGANATATDVLLQCVLLPLVTERSEITSGGASTLVDGGGNVCMCNDEIIRCTASSTTLSIPDPVEPLQSTKPLIAPIQLPVP